MDSKITINIVEPGSGPTPDPVVPNTGLFTSGIGGPEATIITAVSAVLILTIAAIVVAFLYRKQKKSGKVTKLVHLVDSTKAVLKSKKRVTAGLSAIALLASAGTLTTLLASANKNNTNAIEEDGLTLNVTGGDITIEVADEPVFAVFPVELTVEEATRAGYTLTAFTDSTDLVSTTNPGNIIPMVTLPESSVETLESSETVGELSPLTDNTYGLALDEKPTTKDAEVYMPLSTDSDAPTILKDTDFVETEANDTTAIYYGFYITPDVPYGTYTGTNINYNVEPHYTTNLSFNGNGNDGGETIEGITIIAGDTITLPENTYTKEGYNFIGWNTVAEPTEQDPGEAYTDQADYTALEGETKDVTLYAQWEEATLYMQDVAEWKNKLLNTGDSLQAIDSRDGKKYWVTKEADGNIWMTQNLDLDLISDPTAEGYVALTPANTNITADWTPANSTISFTGTSVPGWQSSRTAPSSADPGDVYYYTSNTDDNDMQYNSLEECEVAGHTDCAHYHVGNYYNWSAAVASNDTSSMDTNYENAQDSICPAGWKIPKNIGSGTTTTGSEFGSLLVAEGIVANPVGYYQSYIADGSSAIRAVPLWLVRSGQIDGGSLGDTGDYGNYWFSTALSDNRAEDLSFWSSRVTTAGSPSREYGFSIRCVAR